MHTINKVLRQYYDSSHRSQQRLGQWFVNTYCDGNWPELFHEENDKVSVEKIYIWLLDNGCTNRMPKKVQH